MKITLIKNRAVAFNFPTFKNCDHYTYVVYGKTVDYVLDTACGKSDMEEVLSFLRSQKRTNPLIVVNSHYHWDHIWGNCAFPNSLIVSSEKCRELIKKTFASALKENAADARGDVIMTLPNFTFQNEMRFPDDGLYLFLSPGHTPDGLCVYDEQEKVLYAFDNIGDTLLTPVPELEDSVNVYREALLKMKSLDFDLLLSGHNKPQQKEFLDVILSELTKIKE